MALSREELLALLDKREPEGEDLEVDGWGVFRIRPLSKWDQKQIRDESMNTDGTPDATQLETRLFLAGVVEPKLDADDLELLQRRMNAGTYDAIVTRIAEISAYDIDQESVERRFPGATTGVADTVGTAGDT